MQTGLRDTAFGTSIGLAFIGGYADASSFLTAGTFTGHLTGNCVLAAVSLSTQEWYVALDRLLAVVAFYHVYRARPGWGRFSIRLEPC
jgi:uncharacterized membrane protein YoaK (UPF0700 family)